MYFLVVVAFALLLTDGLPSERWNLLPLRPGDSGLAAARPTLAVALSGIVAVGLAARVCNFLALRRHDGSSRGLDRLAETSVRGGHVVLGLLGGFVAFHFLCTPWIPVVRFRWGLGQWPLAAEVVLIAPFLAATVLSWVMLYPVDRVIRAATLRVRMLEGAPPQPVWGLGRYLDYKFRHQVLVIAVPMLIVILIRHYTSAHREGLARALRIPWAADALLGLAAAAVLLIAPALIRVIWWPSALPPGDLRDRLERLCRRVGLRVRNILVWDSGALIVNAAVMGFVAPIRYVLLSDGLVQSMHPRQIEAVFAHEAGHVRHHHLPFYLVFALCSMMIVGGALEGLVRLADVDDATLQLTAMAATLLIWGAGFGYVSRCFERQADVFGVRAIAPDIERCSDDCAVHGPTAAGVEAAHATAAAGPPPTAALCAGATHVFGSTLLQIADLNGIPREAPSWRHGSITARCRLLHDLARSPAAAARFDRRLRAIKVGLALVALVGAAGAAWLYWPAEAIRALLQG